MASLARTPDGFSAVKRFLPKYLRALVSLPYMFTVGVRRADTRFLLFQIAQHFGAEVEDLRQLPKLPLDQSLGPALNLQLLEPVVQGGNVSIIELLVLAQAVHHQLPKRIFEIGTFDGRTTLNLAANAPRDAEVFTLDLPREQSRQTRFALARGETAFVDKSASGLRFAGTPHASKIRQLYGDSATFDYSPYARSIDLIFIDGSHAYEYALSDTRAALALLNPQGGTIFWHDYQPDWPGVIQALNELRRDEPRLASIARIEGTSLVVLHTGAAARVVPPGAV